MLVIGLTGGIASGKSLVSTRFSELGAPVIDADLLAREVVEPGTPGLESLVERFGRDILAANGTLDRARLGQRVFTDAAERAALDALLHPLIRRLSEQRLQQARRPGVPYAVYAVPLLVETGQCNRFDRIVVVDVPVAVQLTRLTQRDGVDAARAQRMIDAQASRERRLAIADDVIDNTGSRQSTREAVDRLDVRYRAGG